MFQTGDIIFTSKKSIISRFMDLFQSDPVYWGHILIAKNNQTCWEAALTVRESDIESILSKNKHWKAVRKKDLTDMQKDLMRIEAISLLGLRYGFWRVVLQFFDHVFNTNWFTSRDEDKYLQVCSSYAAWMYYRACGYEFNDVDWESCEPDDIEDDQLAHPEIWEVLEERGMRRKR
jgi:hypothetical protein